MERVLAGSESVVVFPQGSILGVEVAFQAGAFRLAARTSRPLLPVVLTGSHEVWKHPYSPALHFDRTIRLEVLPPVAGREAMDSMRHVERTMKRRALAAEPGPRRFDPDRDGWWDGYPYEIDEDFPELREMVHEHRCVPVSARTAAWT
jgi:1-acyl-sn-glycerol-3-phosphate acyltransferase